MRWKGDRVHTTRLKTGKQMCRSATVSSLCTIQQSENEREREKERQEKIWERDKLRKPYSQKKRGRERRARKNVPAISR